MAYRRRSRKTSNAHRRAIKRRDLVKIRRRKTQRKAEEQFKLTLNGVGVRR